MKKFLLMFLVGLSYLGFTDMDTHAEKLQTISLPQPNLELAGTLMHALKNRKSTRSFIDNKALPLEEISNLLWATAGVNREVTMHRTAPSAMNKQTIDVYLVDKNGIYLYDYKNHSLHQKKAGDFRAQTGLQPFPAEASINLIFVAETSRLDSFVSNDAEKLLWASLDTGFMAENAYLYCANRDLAVVVRGSIPKEELAKTMQLTSTQKIILAQSIGYDK